MTANPTACQCILWAQMLNFWVWAKANYGKSCINAHKHIKTHDYKHTKIYCLLIVSWKQFVLYHSYLTWAFNHVRKQSIGMLRKSFWGPHKFIYIIEQFCGSGNSHYTKQNPHDFLSAMNTKIEMFNKIFTLLSFIHWKNRCTLKQFTISQINKHEILK